jgi:HSP20 family protein
MIWPSEIFNEIDRMRRQMNSLFSLSPLYPRTSYQYPLVNMYDKNDSIIIVAEIPGADKDAINIQIINGTLRINGMRKYNQIKNAEIIRNEQPDGKFEKEIRLPVKVKEDAVKAQFENGILTITMPKTEDSKARQISIEV